MYFSGVCCHFGIALKHLPEILRGFVAASMQVTFFISGGAFLKKNQKFCKKVGIFGEEWGKMVTNVQMA
ncbi:hypothetical protein [Gardnerella greenwoodii]|nr:hypothetical protein [Gardnerella greenwoodii]